METRTQRHFKDGIRVVLYGPESTGKTTLAKALAAHYATRWVPEFAREYLQDKWEKQRTVCTLDDLIPIAYGQLEAENKALDNTHRLLFCDTNILVTKVWSETHFNGYCPPEIQTLFETLHYDLYLLTNIDVPWEKDDLRDRPNQRQPMLEYFQQQLLDFKLPYLMVSGSPEERCQQAIAKIDALLAGTTTLPQ
ncbi:MAG: AAA family ATPase [Flavobacteriaceae bacterium]